MIVICTKCQAKFRVADDKIGPRGAKVRCSKCQTVFLVHPVLGTMPVTDGDARHVPSGATPAPPTSASRAPAAEPAFDPFAGRDPFAGSPARSDPFADAGDPFGSAAPAADPFGGAAPAGDPFGGRDPFAAPSRPTPAAAAPAPLGDPFVAAVTPRASLVTDLSDLMSAPAPASGRPPPLPAPRPSAAGAATARSFPPAAPPPEDPFAASAALAAPVPASPPSPDDDPFGLGAPAPALAPSPPLAPAPAAPAAPAGPAADVDPFGAADPFAAVVAAAPAERPEPELDLTGSTPAARPAAAPPSLDVGGLSLEERLTPPPKRIAAEPAPLLDETLETATLETAAPEPAGGAGPDPFAALVAASPGAVGEPFDPGAFELRGDAGEPLEPAAPPQPAPRPVAAPPRPAPPPAPPAAAPAPADVAPEVPERIPDPRGSRARAAAVNAVALVALLTIALALWAVWRTDGPLEAASLRPSAILAALGRGGAPGAWSAQDVRSGVYDRARGAPLLFVRGRVVSHASAAVPSVRVAVQVIRGGQVIARGEAVAGAVPTEEELYLAADDDALALARAAARARAPAAVRPGDAVPFLVATGDAPPDLEGATLSIEVVPGGAAP